MEKKEYSVSLLEQWKGMKDAEENCNATIQKHSPTKDMACPPVWDNIMCWSSAEAGTTISVPCPNYIDRFLINGVAKRTCSSNGSWYVNPHTNSTWTDFTECMASERSQQLLKKSLDHIQVISIIGYAISLVSIVISVVMLLRHKYRINSKRPSSSRISTLHLNLFIAYGLRSITSLLADHVVVEQTRDFKVENSHWECKLIMTLFVYTLLASTVWLSVDAFVLVWMICCNPWDLQRRSNVFPHIIIGWGGPLLLVIPWVILRIVTDDEMCWVTINISNYESWEAWLFRGPVIIINSVNIVYLFLIGRFLYAKNCATQKSNRKSTEFIRKHRSGTKETNRTTMLNAAKHICILIPLLGVPDIFLTVVSFWPSISYLYADMFFCSFQGFMLALSLCFTEKKAVQDLKNITLSCKKIARRMSGSSTRESTSVNTSVYLLMTHASSGVPCAQKSNT